MKKYFLLLFGSVIFTSCTQEKKLNDLQVQVEQGILEGVALPSGIHSFKGIPFAQPPVGELRWKAPQPPQKWEGVLKADAFKDNAMQKDVFGDMKFRSSGMSEDCLYLNVWAPADAKDKKLPVLVYFYGGGFVAGDGSEGRYDGETLAREGIVTVTLNYRLGIFGFFSHPELTNESPNNASGNYGLLDQNAALVWVKNNIAAFGGDPSKITIAGESAGSISVSAQMASPLSKDLISGAIGESGAMIKPTLDAVPLNEAEQNGLEFAKRVNAQTLVDLRKMPADSLLEEASKWGAFNTRATVDGYFLPELPSSTFAAGDQAKVPLLAGWTSAEIPYMAFMQGQYPNPENYATRVKQMFGDKAEEVLKLYPGTTQEEVIQSATALASDNFIVFSTWKWAELHKNTTGQPTYVYKFAQQRPPLKSEFGSVKEGLAGGIIEEDGEKKENQMPAALPGASHASDIEYLLGNLNNNELYNWTEEDRKVTQTGVKYLANFIKTGNPNGENLPQWPVSKASETMNVLTIGAETSATPEQHRDRYLFLNSYYGF
ncbi:carboxylesterase/lipase family protein [Flavobacterium beibuense]|uniref:carboxylesterase/lipase family protein n=1 Tax=Flavobacterium beibuense TaxID=657326 RepID=UPI003A8F0C5B